jgi:phytoene dehydrogenase-like protein
MTATHENAPVVVVGAGLSGLICARELLRAGRQVVVIEAEDSVGGRIRTAITSDGFRIDRGFQVFFAAYPALLRHVRLQALDPRYFTSDVLTVFDGRMERLGHPLFAPGSIMPALDSGLVSRRDMVALAAIALRALPLGDRPLPSAGRGTIDLLRQSGISQELQERVIIPFFSGTSLDRSLSSDATFFSLVLRSMAVGRTFLPASGVQRLPEVLAADLPATAIRLGERVEKILVAGGRVQGVQTSTGEVPAVAVVLATEAPEAARLGSVTVPEGRRSCTTVYLSPDRPLYEGPRLVLNGERTLVNHLVDLTNVSPDYAPVDRRLVAAVIIGEAVGTDDEITTRAVDDIATWLPGASSIRFDPVTVVRVPFSQFAQPPGIYSRLPGTSTPIQGLYLGGEVLHSSSIQGAIRGGEIVAAAVLRGSAA